jgi:hypothetical protein
VAIGGLAVGGVVWLLAAAFLALSLLGHLSGACTSNDRAFRLQATAILVLMTMACCPGRLSGPLGGSSPWSLRHPDQHARCGEECRRSDLDERVTETHTRR